jgi:phosphatidylserine/phosphatidylglycerophosphate/cardiolipin synthase-like enzyme
MKVRVLHNGDDVMIAWDPGRYIEECRGFALLRERNGTVEPVDTWVGFRHQEHFEGETKPSTQWPIQRYQWTDFMAEAGDEVRYRVVPMVGPDKDSLTQAEEIASEWTTTYRVDPQVSNGVQVVFNRGIVASQFVSRRLGVEPDDTTLVGGPQSKTLTASIEEVGNPLRDFLMGQLGATLFGILAEADAQGLEIYAALYELDDPQLEAALRALGKRAHVVLGNGSVKKKGADQNSEARAALADVIDLHDRMTSPRALAHNKFMVVCDDSGTPASVWTGSQNWTKTGLCTQANNSILIHDAALAAAYREQWDRLRLAGPDTPTDLRKANAVPRTNVLGRGTLWFTPSPGRADLAEARSVLVGAQEAILFLMFNPGPADTLLNDILTEAQVERDVPLYIKGALNQDPSFGDTHVELFDHATTDHADFEVVLPEAIDTPTEWFVAELKKAAHSIAMVHSKVIVVDPFGSSPVVMTGSHNLGPKASGTNDENLLILRGMPALAEAYATNILTVYNQYRWRFNRHKKRASTSWDGLVDGAGWQPWRWKESDERARKLREIALLATPGSTAPQ